MALRALLILLLWLGAVSTAWSLDTAETLVVDAQKPHMGDLTALRADGKIRVLVPFAAGTFFIQDGKATGIAIDLLTEFERHLNAKVKNELERTKLVVIPTRRDQIIPAIADGLGDIAVANLTVTAQRLDHLDFSDPLLEEVEELIVTGADHREIRTDMDLARLSISVRASSSYYDSLLQVNRDLESRGIPPIDIELVDESLEDENLMEMVHAGLLPAVVVDSHKADLWLQVFPELVAHRERPVRSEGTIAWAFRKDSPELEAEINNFVARARQGTQFGNTLFARYFSDPKWIDNPRRQAYRQKLDQLRTLFEEAGKRHRIDPMLLAAIAFQESRFDNKARSPTGAVGIMQVLPSTARDPAIGIRDITTLENNIEAGAKYLRFVADTYFNDPDLPQLQRILMALASYNAGPNRVARLREQAEDPNVWFGNVEWAVANRAGREPVRYVKKIYMYYVAFKGLEAAAAGSAESTGTAAETEND
ncbi:MAG: lytic transglycosylase F [Pseudomonadota bacterium]